MDFQDYDPIEIREGTDRWGPFSFDLSGSIPAGDTINMLDIKAYAGSYKPQSAVEDQVEISLIEPGYTPNVINNVVYFCLQYPGDAYKGKTTIVITVTTAAAGVYPFFFHGVKVK